MNISKGNIRNLNIYLNLVPKGAPPLVSTSKGFLTILPSIET